MKEEEGRMRSNTLHNCFRRPQTLERNMLWKNSVQKLLGRSRVLVSELHLQANG
jgi:hypothetical protein